MRDDGRGGNKYYGLNGKLLACPLKPSCRLNLHQVSYMYKILLFYSVYVCFYNYVISMCNTTMHFDALACFSFTSL